MLTATKKVTQNYDNKFSADKLKGYLIFNFVGQTYLNNNNNNNNINTTTK